jgi:hypothetical protein
MAGLFYDPELETRKRVLAAESEIYRQTLKLELHNLHLYGLGVRRRLSVFRWIRPALSVAGPFAALWFTSRRAKAERARPAGLLGKVLLGWRLYQKYGHLVRNLFSGHSGNGRPTASRGTLGDLLSPPR